MDDKSPISLAILARLREETGDKDGSLIRELVDVFCEDAEESFKRFMEYAEAGDAYALSREAHRVKSGAANMGALHLATLCNEVEHLAEAGNMVTAKLRLLEIQDELPRACAGLRDYIASLSQETA